MTESGIAGIIAAVGAVISALMSGTALVITAINTRKINEVHTATNGMSHRLNQLTGESEHAKGVLEGKRAAGDARYAEGVTQGEDHPRQRSE